MDAYSPRFASRMRKVYVKLSPSPPGDRCWCISDLGLGAWKIHCVMTITLAAEVGTAHRRNLPQNADKPSEFRCGSR